MVRTYEPRNPIDPGSKLSPGKTLAIIHYLIAGRPGSWIAKREQVSRNTVASLSQKFRKKLRTSSSVRQGLFEPLYLSGAIDKEFYEWIIYLPANHNNFYARAAFCALRCPSQFEQNPANFPEAVRARDLRLLNIHQSQRFLQQPFMPAPLSMRAACTTCPRISDASPALGTIFYNSMGFYLRAHRIREDSVEDYFLLYTVFFLTHMMTLQQMGITWTEDEIILPEESAWADLPMRYVKQMNANVVALIEHVKPLLVSDPLSR